MNKAAQLRLLQVLPQNFIILKKIVSIKICETVLKKYAAHAPFRRTGLSRRADLRTDKDISIAKADNETDHRSLAADKTESISIPISAKYRRRGASFQSSEHLF